MLPSWRYEIRAARFLWVNSANDSVFSPEQLKLITVEPISKRDLDPLQGEWVASPRVAVDSG